MFTTSCCPVCKKTIQAEKIIEGNEVYMEKTCHDHGMFRILLSKDAARFFDKTFSSPGKEVHERQTYSVKGCPDDCGFCPEHKQHLCTTLIEITGKCNLRCPVCYFNSFSQKDIPLKEFIKRLNTALRTENGRLDVLQISGGEPLLHSEFTGILDTAANMNINRILINTNGLALLKDAEVYEAIKKHRDKTEIYLQFDGYDEKTNLKLRGENLADYKIDVINKLKNDGIKICLAVTLIRDNLQQIGEIFRLAVNTENITGITFQRLTRSGLGESFKADDIMHEDILQAIESSGYLKYRHIVPLPCSHENCTSVSFLFIADGRTYSLGEYIDFSRHQHVVRNKIGFDAELLDYLKQHLSCESGGCCSWITEKLSPVKKLREFADGKASSYKNMKMLRIVVKNFMDAHTFDSERAKKCCVGVSIGNEKIIPFCVNNIYGRREETNAQ